MDRSAVVTVASMQTLKTTGRLIVEDYSCSRVGSERFFQHPVIIIRLGCVSVSLNDVQDSEEI